jgi:hypothetical protein
MEEETVTKEINKEVKEAEQEKVIELVSKAWLRVTKNNPQKLKSKKKRRALAKKQRASRKANR